MENKEQTLKLALNGDINAFQKLFADFQQQLRSYLYRLLTDRNDADDLTHDTFVKAFDKSGAKPPSKCDDNTSESIQVLMSLLATIIALKANLNKKSEEKENE